MHCITSYNIIASNCGVCASTTIMSAVCTDFGVNGDICSFAIQPLLVCDNPIGWKVSNKFMVLLQGNNSYQRRILYMQSHIILYNSVPDPPKLISAKGVLLSSSLALIYTIINQSHNTVSTSSISDKLNTY